ncbi:MAG: hypothetical protein ABI855_06500 [Bacteroidota bacterium]
MKEQSSPVNFFLLSFLVFISLLIPHFSFSQQNSIKVMANFKVEDSGYDKSFMVMENVNTGEKQTLPGQSRFSLTLKLNSHYILSFNKPGYITKKIEMNTSAPADRSEQGFYPIEMMVILMKQYEGVNIVVFNQPVAKYKFSKTTDDFDYDTDYTKQIQSDLKEAEDELAQKKKEEKSNGSANSKANEKAKADSIANSKAEAKVKLEEEQKQKAETKAKQEEEAKAKNDSIALAKKETLAKAEEDKRQQAKAKQEEDERKKAAVKMDAEEKANAAKAQADEEARKKTAAKLEAEEKAKAAKAQADEEARKKALAKQEEEDRRKLNATASAGNDARKSAPAVEGSDKKIMQSATSVSGSELRQSEKSEEVPANVSVEEITESNRTITKATVAKENKELVYRRIIYKWGGIFYFENDRAISKDAFQMATRLK